MKIALSALPRVSPRLPRAEGSSLASDRMDEETRVQESQLPPSRVEVKSAADRLTQGLESINRDLAVSVHEDSGKLFVKVTDSSTGEVVRQIPAEQVLEVEERIEKIVGLFVNDIA